LLRCGRNTKTDNCAGHDEVTPFSSTTAATKESSSSSSKQDRQLQRYAPKATRMHLQLPIPIRPIDNSRVMLVVRSAPNHQAIENPLQGAASTTFLQRTNQGDRQKMCSAIAAQLEKRHQHTESTDKLTPRCSTIRSKCVAIRGGSPFAQGRTVAPKERTNNNCECTTHVHTGARSATVLE